SALQPPLNRPGRSRGLTPIPSTSRHFLSPGRPIAVTASPALSPVRPIDLSSAMAKPKSVYRCTECGHEHPKWVGRCEACGAWNSVAEEPVVQRGSGAAGKRGRRSGTSERLSARPPERLRDVATH